ncbi:MAG TPA: methyltransferase domain-containing protein [Pyrinomonadaceae bacterium]|nr:methyltransferase domain-containing protein [Pyrinomonadaceae bacterium]
MTDSQHSPERELTEAEKQLLLAAGWLRSRYGAMAGMNGASKLTRENLEAFGRVWMGKYLVDWTDAYRSLFAAGYLGEQAGEFSLTERGSAARKTLELTAPLWLYEYDNFFNRAEQSGAHALFCERVYGKNLCQHGLADISQLNRLLDVLRLSSTDRVLDAGCGNGRITEYLHEQTGAHYTGIDLSAEAVAQARARTSAKGDRLRFKVGNLNRLDFEPHAFDALVAIDTLYYVDDLEETLRQLVAVLKPAGQMGIFYTQWINHASERDALLPENTSLAVLLKKHDLNFTYVDLSRAEAEHWQKKLSVLEQLKPEFEREGNLDLYHYRHSEAFRYANWDTEKRSRHLYHVRR